MAWNNHFFDKIKHLFNRNKINCLKNGNTASHHAVVLACKKILRNNSNYFRGHPLVTFNVRGL